MSIATGSQYHLPVPVHPLLNFGLAVTLEEQHPKDADLIEAVLGGDIGAFDGLVLRYQDRLHNVLYRVLHSEEDARDATQEAFVLAYQKLHTFRREAKFYSWLCRVGINNAISRRRRKKVATSSLEGLKEAAGTEPVDQDTHTQPSRAMELSEQQKQIEQAISELSEEFRVVIVLKEIEGLKYEEIAEITNSPVGTIRSRIHRARVELREKLRFLWEEVNE